MNKRWLGVAASVALAVVGTFLLVNYVQGADERALADEETVEVLVVTAPVARGTAVEELEGKVEVTLVPAKLQTPGSVGDLATLEGTYLSTDLVPGEQLLSSRFVSGDSLVALDHFPLPDGMLEFTISLAPERALGGAIVPGDEVAIIASFRPFGDVEGDSEEAPIVLTVNEDGTVTEATGAPDEAIVTERTPSSTHLIIDKALVTSVQVERLPAATEAATAESSGVELAPTGNLLISMAMEAENVERTVFTAEFGNIWLARASDTAPGDPTPIQTRGTVYEDSEGSIDQASVK